MPDKRDSEEDLIVNNVDDLSQVAHAHDRPRTLDEYKPTNMPLSADEIRQGEARDPEHEGWVPRTTENIGDLKPRPDSPNEPEVNRDRTDPRTD